MIKKISFVVGIVLVGLGVYWFYNHTSPSRIGSKISTSTGAIPSQVQIKLSDTHKKEGDLSADYLVDVTYPQVQGVPQDAGTEINRRIEEFVTTSTVLFKTNIAEFKKEKDLPPSEFRMDYTLTALNDKLLSLEFNVYEYMSGAAHPNGFVRTFNYDVKQMRPILTLKDVFVPGSNYLQRVSELSRADLKSQLKEYEGIHEDVDAGTEPKEENFQEFVLTTHGLKLIFNPYQIGPYALGGHEVWIPYEQLKDILPTSSFLLNFK